MKLILLFIAFLIYNIAYAATSATLLLKGSVPAILSIAVAPEPIALLLPLNISQTGTKIATVTERSNNHSGYKVTIASANGGKLTRSATDFIVYTITYGGAAVTLTGATEFDNAFANAAPVDKDVRISYVGVPHNQLESGDYTDSLTFTIAAN